VVVIIYIPINHILMLPFLHILVNTNISSFW
jgi:hypothetical protein